MGFRESGLLLDHAPQLSLRVFECILTKIDFSQCEPSEKITGIALKRKSKSSSRLVILTHFEVSAAQAQQCLVEIRIELERGAEFSDCFRGLTPCKVDLAALERQHV